MPKWKKSEGFQMKGWQSHSDGPILSKRESYADAKERGERRMETLVTSKSKEAMLEKLEEYLTSNNVDFSNFDLAKLSSKKKKKEETWGSDDIGDDIGDLPESDYGTHA